MTTPTRNSTGLDLACYNRLAPLVWLVAVSIASATFAQGCVEDSVYVLEPPGEPAEALGEEGRWGVGWVQRRYRVRVDGSVECDVFLPMRSTEQPADGPFPVVVGIQGGLVDQDAYRWLYKHAASRGFVVVAPRHATKLPIFSTGNAEALLEAIRRDAGRESDPLHGRLGDGRAAIVGHSLGGVVAAKNWLYQPETFSHLGMFASYPADSETFARSPSRDGDRVLSIMGGRDRRMEGGVEKAHAGAEKFEEPTTFAIVEGMNHYQWGDLPSTNQLSRDASPEVATETARRRALQMIDDFLNDFRGESRQLLDSPDEWPEGVLTWDEWKGRRSSPLAPEGGDR